MLQIPASVLQATIMLCAIVALCISRKSDCGPCIALRARDTDRKSDSPIFSARCLCYDVSVRLSVCLSVTEVHWRIIANLGFKFQSKFTAHCSREEGSSKQQHLALC